MVQKIVNIWQYQYIWILTCLVIILPGCGFKLRSSPIIPHDLGLWYIKAASDSHIVDALNELLRINGIARTQDPKIANITIHILEEIYKTRVVTVNYQGKTISTGIYYRVTFEGISKDGKIFAKRQTVTAYREYVDPEIEVLGKREEVELIRHSLEEDVANRILQRLRPHLLKLTKIK